MLFRSELVFRYGRPEPLSGTPIMDDVSVAMCTYNGAAYIQEQLDSISRQTLTPVELVVMDDGSSDGTVSIVESFALAAKFPVVIHTNDVNIGFRENFIRAACACRGKYIAFSDQDDVWNPEKLEKSVAALKSTDSLLCSHSYEVVDRDLRYISKGGHPQDIVYPPHVLKPWGCFPGFTEVFSRELIELIDPRKRPMDNLVLTERLAHDRWVYMLSASLGNTVVISDRLALYRQHDHNVYGSTTLTSAMKNAFARLLDGEPASIYLFYEENSKVMADLLSEISVVGPENYRLSAKEGAAFWARTAEIFGLRADVYSSRNSLEAFRLCIKALANRAYAANPGAGAQGLLRDLISGVLLRPTFPG